MSNSQIFPAESRLVRRQKSKWLKQIFLAVGLGIGIFLLFIFWGIPNAARLVGLMVGSGELSEVDDLLPPQVPILEIVKRDTNQADFALNGYAQAESMVVISLNGKQIPAVATDSEGRFSQQLTLSEGQNSIRAYSYFDEKKPSAESQAVMINLDREIPELEFTQDLSSPITVVGKDKQYFNITAQTEPGAKVSINDRFLFVKEDGSFDYRYRLNEGENVINLVVSDKAGNQSQQEIKIIFRP